MTKARTALLTSGLASLVLAIAGTKTNASIKPVTVDTAPKTSIAGKTTARATTSQQNPTDRQAA